MNRKAIVAAGTLTYALALVPHPAKVVLVDAYGGFQGTPPLTAEGKAEADRLHPLGSRTVVATPFATSTGESSAWTITVPDHTEYSPGAVSRAVGTDLTFFAMQPYPFPPNTAR